MASWWDVFGITQSFGQNGELGTDFGTPQDTPITVPFGGKVTGVGYYPWGGEVDIQTSIPGFPSITDETVLHLDQISVTLGQVLNPGDLIGLSGGQLVGGSHPTSAQYSNGPHTEIDFFTGSPFKSASVDPTQVLPAASSGTAGALSFPIPNPFGGVSVPSGTDVANFFGDLGSGLAGNSFIQQSAIAAFVAAVVLLALFLG